MTVPLFAAEELPVLWLEAGKENESQTVYPGPQSDWSLRYEHRILASGKMPAETPGTQAPGHRRLFVKTPPLKPGVRLHARLFFGDTEVAKAVVASPDPFEDRDAWFEQYPFVLYEPARPDRFELSSDSLKSAGFPHKTVGSYAEIEAHENGVIVIAEKIAFDKERGLMDLLKRKVAEGFSVLVVAPEGDVPIDFDPAVASLSFRGDRKPVLADCSNFGSGIAWAMRAKNGGIVLSPESILPINRKEGKIGTVGPTILDVRFSFLECEPPEYRLKSLEKGRFYFDKDPILRVMQGNIESRYYFKALIETLSDKGPSK